nr:MAG: structural protein [Picornavirales sp.]
MDTSNNSVLGVTQIENEACTNVSIGYRFRPLAKPTLGEQNLTDYLARPRLVQNVTVPTARGAAFTANITQAQLDTWFPSLKTRLAGVHGIRFDLKFTLVSAATPFQQGIVAQCFQYGYLNADVTVVSRGANPVTATNLPHVRHNISETTMTEFTVPYMSAYEFWPLYGQLNLMPAQFDSLGTYTLTCIAPYRILAGSNNPTLKLMVSMHNLELIGSTPLTTAFVTAQSGLDGEAQQLTKISERAAFASSAVRTITTGIPGLDAVGASVSNALSFTSKVASIFGFSKPQEMAAPGRMVASTYPKTLNLDTADDVIVLGPYQANRVEVDGSAGGTNIDEMSMTYVLGRPCQIFFGTIGTADAVGTTIYATDVCPTNFWFRQNSSRPGGNLPLPASSSLTTNAIQPSAMCYLASMFRSWNGSMKFIFTFSKTKLHAGRVILSFIPSVKTPSDNTPISSSIATLEVSAALPQPFSYTKIIDLKDDSVFEFEVPYVCHSPYFSVFGSIGGLTMTVLDPLVSSSTTSATIDYMVEVAAGDDFQFSQPCSACLAPANPNGTGIVLAQSGLELDSAAVNQHTVGETFKSLKQIIQLPDTYSVAVATGVTTTTQLPPWFTRAQYTMATPMALTTSRPLITTRSGNVAAMYSYAVGSTRWTFHSPAPALGNIGIVTSVSSEPQDFGGSSLTVADPRNRHWNGENRILSNDTHIECRIPMYAKVARVPINSDTLSPVTNWAVGSAPPYTSEVINRTCNHRITNNTGAPLGLYISRSAADDARAMCYIGPPPVIIWPSTQSSNPLEFGTVV